MSWIEPGICMDADSDARTSEDMKIYQGYVRAFIKHGIIHKNDALQMMAELERFDPT